MKYAHHVAAVFVFFAVGLVVWGEGKTDSGSKTLPELKAREASSQGNSWVRTGPAVVNMIGCAAFTRLTYVASSDTYEMEAFDVDTNKLAEFKQWTRKVIEPLMDATRDDGAKSGDIPVYELDCYSGPIPQPDKMLIIVPLGSVFENFSVSKFEDLVKYWCTTNSIKGTAITPLPKTNATNQIEKLDERK